MSLNYIVIMRSVTERSPSLAPCLLPSVRGFFVDWW